ncbi:class I SAM-dependent methyltransferase [Cellulomonas uda]|uniref:SAM-dependent methyltransferase n=1 Tax=Cellulomonas uda TaxID=1714 RepID=A0A4Y3KDD5_CELUD|nr:class I SAM-dependent methyltransferase [Cellulomonas uda]NII66828.1 SAM-dependent methyltransferase [Cellulomonas uda]GEA81983.1 SAM-dependent methyltransferase [Cellulomonas uda]
MTDPSQDWRSELHRVRSSSFGRGVEAYAAARPTYPAEAVAWLVPPDARDVVDVGAGTGKLTAGLVALGGLRVTAVEPDDVMRAALSAALAGVDARRGTAEDTGLPDACADVVTVGQAWHWFDPVAASAEVARVLRPGGSLSLVWNVVAEGVTSWADAYFEIVHRGDTLDYSRREAPLAGPQIGPWQRTDVVWTRTITAPALRALAASRSHLIAMSPAERDALLAEVDALWTTHPDLVGRTAAELPYVTRCWRATTLS